MVWLFNLSLFCCLAKINWVESLPFSLYCEIFNRRAAAFKPSLFSRVCLLFFCTSAPPHQYRWLESECSIFVWMCPFKNEIWRMNFFVCTFKCLTGPILPVSLKMTLSYPIQKSIILGGWDMDKEWNVPQGWIQQNEISIVLKLIM